MPPVEMPRRRSEQGQRWSRRRRDSREDVRRRLRHEIRVGNCERQTCRFRLDCCCNCRCKCCRGCVGPSLRKAPRRRTYVRRESIAQHHGQASSMVRASTRTQALIPRSRLLPRTRRSPRAKPTKSLKWRTTDWRVPSLPFIQHSTAILYSPRQRVVFPRKKTCQRSAHLGAEALARAVKQAILAATSIPGYPAHRDLALT